MSTQASTNPAWRKNAAGAQLAGSRLTSAVARWPWRYIAPATLVAVTALLYLYGLSASGWANSYYSAAVVAATKSWKAFLFGSFDAANFITVDKAPGALWVMDLSARLFGVSSWSILAPQALEGVAAVALLYASVRRVFGVAAGFIAGLTFAVTPIAALMFRFNNPDALLVLLLVAAAYALLRAVQGGQTRWVVLAGALVGWAFLAKMLQAFVVVPVFGAVYLLAAPVSLRRRLVQLLAAGAALTASAGWWVAVVALWPAGSRPYIGGSRRNNILNLVFGYNGFRRLTGNETGSVGTAGTAGSWGPTGWTRMFNASFGGQASWLIPSALIFLAALVVVTWRAPRTDPRRAAALAWGGWLLVTATVFSFAQGIIHPYYTVALAPAIGALVGMGAVEAWRRRARWQARLTLAAATLAAITWAAVVLGRSPLWLPWLSGDIVAAGVLAAAALALTPWLRPAVAHGVAAMALAAALAGPVAFSLDTATTPHTGAIPSAGPAVTVRDASSNAGPGAGFGPGGPPQGGFGAAGGVAPGAGFGPPPGAAGFGPPAGGFGGGPGAGPAGGLLDASTPSAALVGALQEDSGSYTWVAATVGANTAAGYQIGTRDPVLAIGGFNGTDQWPSLAVFQQLVSRHQVHYFIAGGGPGGRGFGPGSATGTSTAIATWVEQHFTATTVGGVTLYDLTAPATGA